MNYIYSRHFDDIVPLSVVYRGERVNFFLLFLLSLCTQLAERTLFRKPAVENVGHIVLYHLLYLYFVLFSNIFSELGSSILREDTHKSVFLGGSDH